MVYCSLVLGDLGEHNPRPQHGAPDGDRSRLYRFGHLSLEYLSVPRTLADHVIVLYRTLLAREPDAGGLAGWVEYLAGQKRRSRTT